jgi:hypothetical protein
MALGGGRPPPSPEAKMLEGLFDDLLILNKTDDLHPPLICRDRSENRSHRFPESAWPSVFDTPLISSPTTEWKESGPPGIHSSASPDKHY